MPRLINMTRALDNSPAGKLLPSRSYLIFLFRSKLHAGNISTDIQDIDYGPGTG